MLEDLGLSREKLKASGALDKMFSWQKSDLLPIAVPYGNSSIYTEARLAFRTDDDGNIGLAVHAMRKEPQLDFPYMGYKFSPEDKAQLLKTGNLGKTIEVVTKQGELFHAYVRMDKEQNRPRFFKYNPEKKQGKQEVEAVAEGHKTQVAVNNEGKTNEATKHLKEPLKSEQTEPTADQKQKQERKARRGRKL